MSDTAITYQDLIKEAFIDPIRTVTVIDDEYPTLKELLQQSASYPDADNQNIARLIKITNMCHETHKWSLDVFNGKSPKIGGNNYIPEHLHHSDLLILDYHLDGNQDDGQRAREIINKLDSNNHFNIVLVHTKGVAADNIKQVFEEILVDFYTANSDVFSTITDKEGSIEEWLDENSENYETWLNSEYSITEIASALSMDNLKNLGKPKAPKHIFHSFFDDIAEISKAIASAGDIGFSVDDLILFRLKELVDNCGIKIGASRKDLSWDWSDDNLNYISTGKVFISVVRKSSEDPEQELFEALCGSLNHFDASPMHLLMAKIRHEVDERGLEQAQNILLNRSAQAGWLYSLLSNDQDSFAHDKAIDLHWEQLGRASKNSLRAFSQKISGALSRQDNAQNVVKKFFRECINSSDESCGHLNAFTCSMPVVGSHLNTGSILSFDGEYWVCLTPACDLVPDQKAKRWKDRIGEDPLPLKAVKLHEALLSTANGKANSNEYIYLNLEDSTELKVFSFFESDSPTWDTFYALNQGRFTDDTTLDLAQVREKEGVLSINNVKAQVVAELRYEYALNLLQRFGANQTRVGLDFIEKKNLW